jgi:hypothetical protein
MPAGEVRLQVIDTAAVRSFGEAGHLYHWLEQNGLDSALTEGEL